MPYRNMTAEQIYQSVYKFDLWKNNMEAWIEAQNVMEIRRVIADWFYALQNGTVSSRYPDPRDTSVTQEKADKLVQMIDDDFWIEHNRYIGLKVETGPEFSKRLSPSARLAMAQEVYSAFLTDEQIKEEAAKRIENGDLLPGNDKLIDYTQQQRIPEGYNPYDSDYSYSRSPTQEELESLSDIDYYMQYAYLAGAF